MSSSVLLPASEDISKISLGLSLAIRLTDRPKFSLSFLCVKKKEAPSWKIPFPSGSCAAISHSAFQEASEN